ncbi:MAG: hypothetical protein RLZZ301_3 [Bacteroidota bacterium]|jgi:hypothetical protein
MNLFYGFLAGICLCLSSQTELPYATIQRGMESNDAHSIVALSRDKLVLNISGSEAVYAVSQAEMILQSFFQKHPKGVFVFRYKAKSTDPNGAAIGSYVTKGESFRCSFQFRSGKTDTRLESLSILKEN